MAITTRHGGVSAPPYDTLNLGLHVGDEPANVMRNRARAVAAFGVALDATVFARQVHGTAAASVGPEDGGRGAASENDAVDDTDILVTASPGITLAILVADCVPLALVDPAAHVLAAVHAGWRGHGRRGGGRRAACHGGARRAARARSGLPRSGRATRRATR